MSIRIHPNGLGMLDRFFITVLISFFVIFNRPFISRHLKMINIIYLL